MDAAPIIHRMKLWTGDTSQDEVSEVGEMLKGGRGDIEFQEVLYPDDDDLRAFDLRRESSGIQDTASAGSCVLRWHEARRTGMLLRAIEAASNRRNAKTILSAGAGPFAIDAIASAIFDPDAKIYAVEGCKKSAEHAQKTVDQFGLDERIEVIHADLTRERILFHERMDRVVSETFCAGMTDERGVQILRSTVQDYGHESTETVPESISVHFSLVPMEEYFRGRISITNPRCVTQVVPFGPQHNDREPLLTASFPCEDYEPGCYTIVASTTVTFNEDNMLSPPGNSAICNDVALTDIRIFEALAPGSTITLQYKPGKFEQEGYHLLLPDGARKLPRSFRSMASQEFYHRTAKLS